MSKTDDLAKKLIELLEAQLDWFLWPCECGQLPSMQIGRNTSDTYITCSNDECVDCQSADFPVTAVQKWNTVYDPENGDIESAIDLILANVRDE